MPGILLNSTTIACSMFLVLFRAVFVSGDCECFSGWEFDARKGRCIKIMGPPKSHDDASLSCKQNNAELLRMEDDLDRQFMVGIPMFTGETDILHIGGSDKAMTGDWIYENGDHLTWLGWETYQPDGGEDCMTIARGGSMYMYDFACTAWKHYVCMMKLDNLSIREAYYNEEPSKCLVKHSVCRKFSMVETMAPRVGNECINYCTSKPCCTAIATNTTGCILYTFNETAFGQECVDVTYAMHKKITNM